MKRITLFLTTCLGLSVFQTALCADTDSVRAATKRGATNTVQTKSVSTRSTNTSSKNNLEHSENTRTSTQSARTATNVQSRTPTTQKQTVKQRVSVPSRQAKTVTTRTQSVKPTNSVVSRTASTKKSDTKQKSTATRKAVNKQPKHVGRATTFGIAASAIKNAGLEIAFVDDFGRAFKTKLSDSINVIPYGRAFGKLQNNEDNFVTIFDNLEFGFKKTNILESNGFITSKSNNLTNFVGYKNEFVFDNFSIYQNVRFGTTAPKSEYNSIINGFSNIYTSSVSTGIKWNDFIFELSIPETILYGNMYMNLPIGRANDGQMLYNQTNINLKTKPSVEYSVKYKNIYAGYINNYDYQDEFFIMAKTKFTF